jgi:beta-phosphoglucomutase-like phosphatase (HAD superfamily)
MTRVDAIIFDFDGVLVESEFHGNQLLADLLTEFGHPTSVEEAINHFVGLSGPEFLAAIERRIGGPLPPEFRERRKAQTALVLKEGLRAVAGAIEFVSCLPPDMPRAIASGSTTRWIRTHLDHLGLADDFGEHLYSGREHVERGKPAPDLYHYAADQLGVDIRRCAIIEDSEIGATGAVASGALVVGLAAGKHILDGHEAALRALGVQHVAHSFDEVRRLLQLD